MKLHKREVKQVNSEVERADVGCVVTSHLYRCEVAHLQRRSKALDIDRAQAAGKRLRFALTPRKAEEWPGNA